MLILDGRSFEPLREDRPGLAAAEQQALDFCRRWRGGQETFTLRTSGSTGEPKPITLRREQMAASARLTGQALGLKTGDRALVCLSAEYIAGLMMLVRGLELGLELTIIPPAANPLANFPIDTAFDFTAMVPLQLEAVFTETPEKIAILAGMRAILVGGAPLGTALLDKIRTLAAPVYHTYGMTETVSHIALRRLNGPGAGENFIPLPGVETGTDRNGCLTVCSVLTRHRTLVTRDRVELHPDGSFRWLGRIDNVINSGGVKVQAEAVETALDRLFGNYPQLAGRRFFVGPLDDARLGQAVAAVIEGTPISPALQAELRERLRDELSSYEIPRRFLFRPRLLETPTGKIDRRANLAVSSELSQELSHERI